MRGTVAAWRASVARRRDTLARSLAVRAPATAPDLVLHIGSGKTGTTGIQTFLANNRARLAEHGVLYPDITGGIRHYGLSLSVIAEQEVLRFPPANRVGYTTHDVFAPQFMTDLRRSIAQARLPRLLLSDEGLFGMRWLAIQDLRRLTDEIAGSLRLVVYLRRQDDHLISRYQQVVKVGETMRLVERVRELDQRLLYNYHRRLVRWREFMEPESFVVRPFERSRFPQGSLLQDFLDSTGVDLRADELNPPSDLNESLDAEQVELLRLVNIYRVSEEGAIRGQIDNRELIDRMRRVNGEAPGPTLTLPPAMLDAFMASWQASNEAVARDFLDDPAGRLFSAPRKSDRTTSIQVFDPARLDLYLDVLRLPKRAHRPLRDIVEREAAAVPCG